MREFAKRADRGPDVGGGEFETNIFASRRGGTVEGRLRTTQGIDLTQVEDKPLSGALDAARGEVLADLISQSVDAETGFARDIYGERTPTHDAFGLVVDVEVGLVEDDNRHAAV